MTEKTYVCEASGDTYPIREDLKKLGFRYDGDRKIWTAIGITEKEKLIFNMQVSDRRWPKVILKFLVPSIQESSVS